jgi:hypothetical protein
MIDYSHGGSGDVLAGISGLLQFFLSSAIATWDLDGRFHKHIGDVCDICIVRKAVTVTPRSSNRAQEFVAHVLVCGNIPVGSCCVDGLGRYRKSNVHPISAMRLRDCIAYSERVGYVSLARLQ